MREKVYLLGHPIAHSKSPAMHNALYRELGLDWEYELKDCATEEEAQRFIEQGEYRGINITTPYKPVAFAQADIKASSAKLAQGANVLARKNAVSVAYNVDGEGCVSYLERTVFDFRGTQVVVCGTGPTALAIVHTAAQAGADKITLIGRNKERSERTLNRYLKEFGSLAYATIALPPTHDGWRSFREAYDETKFTYGSYKSTQHVFSKADLVINATPIGMKQGDTLPFDPDLLHEGQTVFDVVYGHGKTELIAAAQARGCKAYDGSGMLVAQAVATDRIFFDIAELALDMSDIEMFDIMARAADFEC